LLANARNFEVLLVWEREYSRKTPVWEQVQLTFLNIPGWGSKIPWKFPTWEQVKQTSFKKSLESSGLSMGFIQPTEVYHIPGQDKFEH
jgi:hypothetical protein